MTPLLTKFVQSMLTQAKEDCEGHYELQRLGYDLHSVTAKVAAAHDINPDEVLRKGRPKTWYDRLRNRLCRPKRRNCCTPKQLSVARMSYLEN